MDLYNWYISFFAWAAYNVIIFRIAKDEFDKRHEKFQYGMYFSETWDNWLSSLVMVPILLWLGYRQLHIIDDPLTGIKNLHWSDLYYLMSGFITELVIDRYKAWRGKSESK